MFKEDGTRYGNNWQVVSPENQLETQLDDFRKEMIELFADYQKKQLELFLKYNNK